MKKNLNFAMIYTIIGLLCGVYYREFSKMNDFVSEETVLKGVHTHYLVLGMLMFLILASFQARFDLEKAKTYKAFLITYNIGLNGAGILLLVRGTVEVMRLSLSSAANGAISGIAGLAHMTMAVGLILMFVTLKKAGEKNETAVS
ncbi:MAG: DUF2871 domain-containing protein [Lachnospiraceae bacterium]